MSPFRPRSYSPDCPAPFPNHGRKIRRDCSTPGHLLSSGDGVYTRKRHRRDSLSTTSASPKGFLKIRRYGPARDDAFHSKSPSGRLATTPAEFNLFQGQSSFTSTSGQSQRREVEGQQERHGWAYVHDSRSSAFWELRQSIIENGEGLVRRMRDYESSQSHYRLRHHAKESRRRGRTQRSLRSKNPPTPQSVSEASDEDDVLIFSGDASVDAFCGNLPGGGRRSFDTMDVDDQGKDQSRSSQFILACNRYSGADLSDDGGDRLGRFPGASRAIPDLETCDPQSSSSRSTGNAWLPRSSASRSRFERAYDVPETSTDKALAALNVALADGAGSISDRSFVWAYQKQFRTDSYYDTADDLWH